MNTHKYILEPYKGMNTRYRCPAINCGKDKTFSLYIDTETGEHIHPSVGRCNRESNCGYHYTPKQYFQDNNFSFDKSKSFKPQPIKTQTRAITFIPVEVLKASLKGYENNYFVNFLIQLFGTEITTQLIKKYFIATSKHWNGATVFWQIDTQGKVRTGKIMLYNADTGKRIKEPCNYINWVHKAFKMENFNLQQCLFGEHLLIDKTKPVAIVESEKTAIISSIYFPQFIWLAFGGIGFNIDKCNVLKGRTVTLFPDLNGFEKWNNKAKELSHLANFTVSDLLERKANEVERKQGFDFADYLIKFDYKAFTTQKEIEQPQAVQYSVEVKPFEKVKNWGQNITEFENYFSEITLPTQPIKLNSYTTIKNVSYFIKTHIATIKANEGKKAFLPYIERLNQLQQILNSK